MDAHLRRAALAFLASACLGRAEAQPIDFDREAPVPAAIIGAIQAQAADSPASPMVSPLVYLPSAAQDFSAWMRAEGWRSKRDQPRGWTVGGDAIHMRSDGNSVLIATKKRFPRDIRNMHILRLRLKVISVPRGTDLYRKNGDDAALRVYAAFDRGGGVIAPPNTIGYTWTEKEDAGTLIASAHFSNLFYISLGKGPTPGEEWVVVERDLAADYRRAFPADRDLPRLGGLGLKCDSNDTKTSAEALLSAIEVRSN